MVTVFQEFILCISETILKTELVNGTEGIYPTRVLTGETESSYRTYEVKMLPLSHRHQCRKILVTLLFSLSFNRSQTCFL